jgi:hypothetical protein
MMYLQTALSPETDLRLARVFAQARLEFLEGAYSYIEFPASAAPMLVAAQAISFVRDEDAWSALVPSPAEATERFFMFRIHFPPGEDNAGFVGWLASRLRQSLGTGVIVVCGYNASQGGVFDYWGVPHALKDRAVAMLNAWREAV